MFIMTIEEKFNQMRKEVAPVKKECSTCAKMAYCWYHNQGGFAFDAVKECWEPVKVPSYIKNIETK